MVKRIKKYGQTRYSVHFSVSQCCHNRNVGVSNVHTKCDNTYETLREELFFSLHAQGFPTQLSNNTKYAFHFHKEPSRTLMITYLNIYSMKTVLMSVTEA